MWHDCVEQLQSEMLDVDYLAWIKPLKASLNSNGTLTIVAPNNFIKEHIEENHLALLKQTISKTTGCDIAFTLVVAVEPAVTTKQQLTSKHNTLFKIDPSLNHDFQFKYFVNSSGSELAYTAAQKIATSPGSLNPLFICGNPGLGKTHLMQSIGHQILHNQPKSRVYFVRSVKFLEDFVAALKGKTTSDFKEYYRSLDTLLIDDIHILANKPKTQVRPRGQF